MANKEDGGLFFCITLLNKFSPLNGSATADTEVQSGPLSWCTKNYTLVACKCQLLCPIITVPKLQNRITIGHPIKLRTACSLILIRTLSY